MSRKSEKFFDAVTHLREDLIEEAQNYKFRKKNAVWKKYGSLAACIVLIMSIGFLAVLPRGCGGSDSSGGSDFNSSTAPQESAPSGDAAPPPFGGNSYAPAEGQPEPEEYAGLYQFTAIVVEVRDEALLVEPIEYDFPRQYLIPSANQELPDLSEGDWVSVTCTSDQILALAGNPAELVNVQSIKRIDPPE